jgi:gluconate 2-dehydrogenase gamma chain
VAGQIIPSDETPGAREAGVVYFIDRALSTFAKDKREAYRIGLAEVQLKCKALFPESTSMAGLTAPQQIELLLSIEKSAFFELLRLHSVLGFLSAPSYGGNREGIGWKLIGFEDRMSFEPPFGYYDHEAGT